MIKLLSFLIAAVIVIISCTNNISDSGGASETIASITITGKDISGKVINSNNELSEITIKVFDHLFTPLDSTSYGDTLITNASDTFNMSIPDTGYYNLLITNNSNQLVGFYPLLINDSNYSLIDTLKQPGSIEGNISDQNELIYISLLGTDFSTSSDSIGVFNLHDIPEGNFSLFVTPLSSSNNLINIEDIKNSSIVKVESNTNTKIKIPSP